MFIFSIRLNEKKIFIWFLAQPWKTVAWNCVSAGWLWTGFCVTTNQRRDIGVSRPLIGWHYVKYDCSVFSTEECGLPALWRLLVSALLTVTKPVAWVEIRAGRQGSPLLSHFRNKEIPAARYYFIFVHFLSLIMRWQMHVMVGWESVSVKAVLEWWETGGGERRKLPGGVSRCFVQN